MSLQIVSGMQPLHIEGEDFRIGERHEAFPQISDELRFGIRDRAKYAVLRNLGYGLEVPFENAYDYSLPIVPEKIKKILKDVCLYVSPDSEGTFRGNNLLGRFDVLQVPCRMAYDENWEPYKEEPKMFYVHNVAALNVGEWDGSKKIPHDFPEDFLDYSTERSLDEEKYLFHMEKIFRNVLLAQKASGISYSVLFPFGMGAFLRKLPQNDRSYQDKEKMFALRTEIAKVFVKSIVEFSRDLSVHLSLPFSQAGEENTENYHAFIRAIRELKAEKRLEVSLNSDATKVAQSLANRYGEGTVSLMNAANRDHLLGNIWWWDRPVARFAMDENLVRRSEDLPTLSYVINGGVRKRSRDINELVHRVAGFGGSVLSFLESECSKRLFFERSKNQAKNYLRNVIGRVLRKL